jgi:hypothetical protein
LPGERRGGRQKGTPNKADATIKDMVINALQHVGGAQYLARQAEQNPVAFMALVSRVLPLQLAGHDGGKLEVEFRWRDDPQPATINGDAVSAEDEPPSITFLGEC